jgi:hypothetical protein
MIGHTGNDIRTAVLISGHLRVGNISFATDLIRSNNPSSTAFGGNPHTPIETVFEYFLEPLSRYSAIDLFLYVPVPEGTMPNHSWNGDPLTYQPYPGDYRVCALYSSHKIFTDQASNNKVFCKVEFETVLSNKFIANYKIWVSYVHRNHGREAYLRQEYGKYITNLAVKEYAIASGVSYTYKVRLRPDLAFRKNMSNLMMMKYRDVNANCHRAIYSANDEIMGGGAEDSFNYGEAKTMDYLLDRYMEILTDPEEHIQVSGLWMAEPRLKSSLQRKGICLIQDQSVWMEKIRLNENVRSYNVVTMEKHQDWIDMKSKR